VPRADDGEVPVVERGDFTQLEPFGERDDRGVHRAQRQVGVALDQLGDAVGVWLEVVHQPGAAGPDVGEEGQFRLRAAPSFQQQAHLGEDRGGEQQGTWMGLQEVPAALVVVVAVV
jgi:hypothetical protein